MANQPAGPYRRSNAQESLRKMDAERDDYRLLCRDGARQSLKRQVGQSSRPAKGGGPARARLNEVPCDAAASRSFEHYGVTGSGSKATQTCRPVSLSR